MHSGNYSCADFVFFACYVRTLHNNNSNVLRLTVHSMLLSVIFFFKLYAVWCVVNLGAQFESLNMRRNDWWNIGRSVVGAHSWMKQNFCANVYRCCGSGSMCHRPHGDAVQHKQYNNNLFKCFQCSVSIFSRRLFDCFSGFDIFRSH